MIIKQKENRYSIDCGKYTAYWDGKSKELWAVNKDCVLPILDFNYRWEKDYTSALTKLREDFTNKHPTEL